MSDTTTAEDRCRGVLIGLAAGDRIGGPIRMAVRLAESLLEIGRFDAADVLDRYLAWWLEGAFDTGPVSARALAVVAAGMPLQRATAQVHREFGGRTAGCNPAHRTPPLAMLAAIDDDDLTGCAMAEARLTHHDPLAGEVAAAVNKLCRALIRGGGWDVALRQCGGFAGHEGPGNNGGFAPDVLSAAVFFVGTSGSFTEALEMSLAFAGPANYCPVLVGAIAGARWAHRRSRRRLWPTSKSCPGSKRQPTLWLPAGSRTEVDDGGPAKSSHASFAGISPVEVAVRLGRPLQVELLDIDGREGPGGDQFPHVPVQVAAIGEPHLQPVEPALPFLDARLRAEAMFQEQEATAWLEYPVHFA